MWASARGKSAGGGRWLGPVHPDGAAVCFTRAGLAACKLYSRLRKGNRQRALLTSAHRPPRTPRLDLSLRGGRVCRQPGRASVLGLSSVAAACGMCHVPPCVAARTCDPGRRAGKGKLRYTGFHMQGEKAGGVESAMLPMNFNGFHACLSAHTAWSPKLHFWALRRLSTPCRCGGGAAGLRRGGGNRCVEPGGGAPAGPQGHRSVLPWVNKR